MNGFGATGGLNSGSPNGLTELLGTIDILDVDEKFPADGCSRGLEAVANTLPNALEVFPKAVFPSLNFS